MNFQPTQLQERVSTLDVLRGFSLFGIILVNIFAFSSPQPHVDLNHWFVEAIDIIWYQNLQIYVQSSFYPLFSMLFGYGLAMQYMKMQRNGENVFRFIPKRLIILFVIGMLHALLLWWGDIIATYAFTGFFVLLLLRFKPGMLLGIALLLSGIFYALYLGGLSLMGVLQQTVEPYLDIEAVDGAITAYSAGNYMDAFMQRLTDLSIQMNPLMWIMSLFIILPYMLIGAAAAKWRLVERAKELKALWLVLAVVGLAGGLFLKSTPYMIGDTNLFTFLQVYIGGPLLAVGYAAVIVLLCMLPVFVKVLSPIAKIGRMSMTMYILQTIIGTTLFYQYGFGLYGKLDVPTTVYVAIAIYVVQVILAELWLSKFKQGPLEAGVKRLTYGKMSVEK